MDVVGTAAVATACANLGALTPSSALAVASLFVYALGPRGQAPALTAVRKCAVLHAYPLLASKHRLVVGPILAFVKNLGETCGAFAFRPNVSLEDVM